MIGNLVVHGGRIVQKYHLFLFVLFCNATIFKQINAWLSICRPNIYLEIHHKKGITMECFEQLVEQIRVLQEDAPKTIIYCR